MLTKIADHFDSTLHAPAAELLEIGQHAHVDVPLGSRHVDVNGIEIIPTPGHTPGSTCYLVNGAEGKYLFTGDTMGVGDSGAWWAGYFAGFSDADALAHSLRLAAHAVTRCGDFQCFSRRLGRTPYPAGTLDRPRRRGARRSCRKPEERFARLRVNGVA